MKPLQIANKVAEMAGPSAEAEGLDLVHVEFRRESTGWVLRLYIDREGGVNLDDCARLSRHVGVVLEESDFIDSPYNLEVSSPGLNRPLFCREDYIRFRGRRVRIRLKKPMEGRRRFVGSIGDASDKGGEIADDEGSVHKISWDRIERANLEYTK